MKWQILILSLLCISVYCTGCTQPQQPITPAYTEPLSTPTPTPQSPRPQITIPPTPVMTITAEPTKDIDSEPEEYIEPVDTIPPIPPAERNTQNINFTKFRNGYFMAEYPDTWTVENESITLSDSEIMQYGQDAFRRDARGVTFSSEDRNTSMRVMAKDWIIPGYSHPFQPTIGSVRDEVHKKYPNSSVDGTVYNYLYTKNDQAIFTAKYDVFFPVWSEYYPYAYSEETWTTYNHLWYTTFISKRGNLDEYNELRYRMMKSVVTEGSQMREWW